MAHGQDGHNLDPASRLILGELRDLRVEMRGMRVEMRDMRVEMREMRVEMRADRARSDERFERVMRDTQQVFREFRTEIGTVGLSIVKTLNRNTRILEHHGQLLERIDRKLGARGNGRPGPKNGRGG